MIGRTGSSDRVIWRRSRKGVYLSVRVFGRFGVCMAFGPGYTNSLSVRR